MKKDNLATIACIGALAFIAACVSHEVIGHGGASLATGGHVTLISPVYFRATNVGPITDAAGPISNLILGALLFAWLRRREVSSPHWRLFLVATMALNLFWGTGLFIYTGISKTDDWAFLMEKSQPGTVWLIRGLLVLIGLLSYRFSIGVVRKALLPFAGTRSADGPARPLFRLSLILYLSAGGICCLSALPYRGELGPAVHDSILESFGAFLGLLFIAIWQPHPGQSVEQRRDLKIVLNWQWIAVTILCATGFIFVLGRGYFSKPNQPAHSIAGLHACVPDCRR